MNPSSTLLYHPQSARYLPSSSAFTRLTDNISSILKYLSSQSHPNDPVVRLFNSIDALCGRTPQDRMYRHHHLFEIIGSFCMRPSPRPVLIIASTSKPWLVDANTLSVFRGGIHCEAPTPTQIVQLLHDSSRFEINRIIDEKWNDLVFEMMSRTNIKKQPTRSDVR